MNLISLIGIITLLLGTTLALAQGDIKRSLAYLAVSQLGYIMLAPKHVVEYSPDKSQNMVLMGGFRKYIIVTRIMFLLGTLSLCGEGIRYIGRGRILSYVFLHLSYVSIFLIFYIYFDF
ncbi:Polyphosphate kinase protein [Dioscorea alata]|uniref:Polyphosphate kinase protein n=1 Tax=Dioscorea alata TaxID=55571 RepID=A0ACB7UXV6_DIOAL|nr:Polyphosphate kinase protein [Dioscorea alata]